MYDNKVNDFRLILIAVALSSILLISDVVLLFILLGFLFIIAYDKWNTRLVITVNIVFGLVLVSDIDTTLRFVIQIAILTSLSLVYLSKFGLTIKPLQKIPRYVVVFFIVYLFSVLFSVLLSDYLITGFYEGFRIVAFFVIIYFFFSLVNTYKDILTVVFSILLSAIILMGAIYIQFISSGFSFSEFFSPDQLRVTGIMSNVNAPGGIVIIIVPILIAFLYNPAYKKYKLINLFLISFLIFGISLTASRSAFLGLLISIVVVFFYLDKKKLNYLFLCFFVFILFIFVFESLNENLNLLLRLERGLNQRDHLWTMSWNMFLDNPLTGIGPGTYSYYIINYLPVNLNSYSGQMIVKLQEMAWGTNVSHNLLLSLISDFGILGFLILFLLLRMLYLLIFENLKIYKDSNHIFLIYGIASAIVGLFVRSIFEGIGILTNGWIKVDLPFWLLVIILIRLSSLPLNDKTKIFST